MTSLKQKIVQAVPSIMELKFGCFVRLKRNERVSLVVDAVNTDRSSFPRKALLGTPAKPYVLLSNGERVPQEEIEILGRPIRLADVLAAMRGETRRFTTLPGDETKKWIQTYSEAAHQADVVVSRYLWNLFEDDLDKQTPATIQFLESILL